MANIAAKDVMELRKKTGIGMMECKKALVEAEGDFDQAMKILREKGLAVAAKKSDRIAAEGVVDILKSDDGLTTAIVEVNSETDFVANNATYVCKTQVPQSVVDNEKEILLTQIKNDPKSANKPEAIIAKMVEGRVSKFYDTACLLEQQYVKDDDLKVGKYVENTAKALGGEIKVVSFVSYERGEGLEKREDDFAAEIDKLVNGK